MNQQLQKIIQDYQLRFDELNSICTEIISYFGIDGGYEKAKEKFDDCLFWFYVDGFSSGILMTGEELDMPNGYEFLNIRYLDGETVEEKFDRHFKNEDDLRLAALLESEAHRMYNTGSLASAGITVDTETGQPVPPKKESSDASESTETTGELRKTWVTMADGKVRDTHWYLEGETIPVDEEFVTFDGDYALAPGMFQMAQNNANCRCILTYSRATQ